MAVTKTKNLVLIRGYVEGEAKFHYFDNSDKVGNFVLKTFSVRKTEAGHKNEPEFTRCEVWGNVCPSMETDLKHGNFIAIEGYMRTTKYFDDKQRHMTFFTKVICTDLSLLCTNGK